VDRVALDLAVSLSRPTVFTALATPRN
jgi:hypothetical protein